MTLQILDPGMFGPVAKYWAQGQGTWSGDTSGLTDSANASPTFDTDHVVYTAPIVDRASQNAIGDNSGGLQDPLSITATLSYEYTEGYTVEQNSSQAVTVGVQQAFNYEFLGVGGSTTLSASGTFTWGQGTSEDKTTSVSQQLSVPIVVPKGKIYEAKLLFSQEQAQVPYTTTINVNGDIGNIHYPGTQGGPDKDFSPPVGRAFAQIETNYAAADENPGVNIGLPQAYKDVNYRDVHAISDASGIYLLHGTLTLEDAGTASVKFYDITNQNNATLLSVAPVAAAALRAADDPSAPAAAQAPAAAAPAAIQAAYDPAVPIGVHQSLDDAGRAFVDSPFDDYVDGGAGNDHTRLSGGEDIVHAAGGDDTIEATGVGRSLLDGGDGDDRIDLTSGVAFNHIMGGAGDDRIRVDAPATLVDGGAGDDGFWLNGATAGGTVVVDTQGANHLEIDTGGVPLRFERVPNSDNLYILLDGGETYDQTRDVAWVDFFADPDNQVDGLTVAEIDDLAVVFQPAAPAASSADFA